MAKITGIGGVFFKAKGDGKSLREWYRTHLGMELSEWGGAALEWPNDTAEDKGVTAWHIADAQSEWFSGGFLINYRIDDMDGMIAQLKAGGVAILKGPEYHENGAFLWVMDPDGNKVELWEPKNWDAKNKR